jgi:uncharacterized protein
MIGRRAAARRWLTGAAITVALGFAVPAFAQGPLPDSSGLPAHGESYVTDAAGLIGADRSAQLESYLDQLQKKTGVQFAVVTVPTTNGEDPAQYKVRLFKAWGIGRKEEKDGLLLLVAKQERRAVFEVGYGLEGTLPDGWDARMLRELLVPRFQAGETADGITVAVLAASERIATEKGVTLQWTGDELHYTPHAAKGRIPEKLIVLVLFLVIMIVSNALRGGRSSRGGMWLGGGPYIGGGWGGGFGGGGGGGGSFGGFGGGSSGGGGGGASW